MNTLKAYLQSYLERKIADDAPVVQLSAISKDGNEAQGGKVLITLVHLEEETSLKDAARHVQSQDGHHPGVRLFRRIPCPAYSGGLHEGLPTGRKGKGRASEILPGVGRDHRHYPALRRIINKSNIQLFT